MSTARGAAVGRRRPPVGPDEARRRRTMLLAGVASVAVVAGAWWVVTGPPGRIASVSVSGYDRPDKALVDEYVTAVARRGTVLDPPVAAIRSLSVRFPWIEDVHASRALPRGLDVQIVQATPGAIVVASRGPKMLVSDTGRVLGVAAGTSAAVPRVRIPGDAPLAGTRISSPVVAAALEFSAALDPHTARRVLALRRSDGALVGRLAGGPELRLGLPEDLPQKAHALDLVLSQLSAEDEQRATYIDLSVPTRPAVGNLVASTQTAPTVPPPAPTSAVPSGTPSTGTPGTTTSGVPATTPGQGTGTGTAPATGAPATTGAPTTGAAPSASTAPTTVTDGATVSGSVPATGSSPTGTPQASLPGGTTPSGSVPPPAP